ncbi:MAG TPA: hypothetical protein VFA60_07250 [Terriglobales bacterium]|nr:hypothetical protein [Terriglobales bacterium]
MENIFVLILMNLVRALWFRVRSKPVTIGSITPDAPKPENPPAVVPAAPPAEVSAAPPPEPESLCSGCTWGQFIRGRGGEIMAVCRYSPTWIVIGFPVAECNYFRPSMSGDGAGFVKLRGVSIPEEEEMLPLGAV